MCYPFLLEEFLDEFYLTREEFAAIIGKDLGGVAKIELRKGLTTRENSLLCREFGREAVAEFYDMHPNMRSMRETMQNMQ